MTTVGIDFGTTNSVVAKWTPSGIDVLDIDPAPGEWANHGFSRVMPSVFATSATGDALFGWTAKGAETRPFEAVKRLFGTQQEVVTDDAGTMLAVEEVATMIFAEMKRSATGLGVPASQAVVTVPANSRGLARHRTKVCAGMSGLEVLALLNEPTAAAMAYAWHHPGDQQILVYDWGGGTLDVTILRSVGGIFMEQASKGLPAKGGLDFDTRLSQAVLDTITDADKWDAAAHRFFRSQIELAKVELSSHEETELQLPGGQTRRVTRTMFEHAVQSLVEESRRPLEQCLHDIGAGPGVIDAVVMVGGTSKIPLVRNFVSDVLGREPVASIDPMTAVGEGAAIAAAILRGELETNDFFVSTEHALGTITHNGRDTTPHFSVLIPRNHMLPAERRDRFLPAFADQESVKVNIIEGDPDLPVEHHDNVVLTSFDVELPPRTDGSDRSFDITYHYDRDGILHVKVDDTASGERLGQHDVTFGVSDDKRQLVRMASRARSTVESRVLSDEAPTAVASDPEVAILLERARVKVIPFLDDHEADEVRDATDRLETADDTNRQEAKSALQAVLASYPYLF